MCLRLLWCIYSVEEGQPLLGNDGAFRSWHTGLDACPFGAALLGVLLTPLTLQGQGLQLDALTFSVPDTLSNSVVTVAPQLGPQAPPEQRDFPQQSTASPLGSQETRSGTSNDRILWTMPNFLTVEDADRIPALTPGQKFKVVARGVFDPFEFVLVGFVAGLGQASNSAPAYGQGMQGYAKRYGTSYADNAIENFMPSAVFPSILHQDPRYYQLGQCGFRKRTAHAVSRVLITAPIPAAHN